MLAQCLELLAGRSQLRNQGAFGNLDRQAFRTEAALFDHVEQHVGHIRAGHVLRRHVDGKTNMAKRRRPLRCHGNGLPLDIA